MKDQIVWGMIGCGDVTEVKNSPGPDMADHSVHKMLGHGSFSGTLDNALETLAITSGVYFG